MENTVKYLVKVDPNANNSKYYKMIPQGDSFLAEYGRLGTSNYQTATYNISQWNKKYNEKIKKGYEDKSELIEELVEDINENMNSPYSPIPNIAVAKIVDRLQKMASDTINRNYQISATQVTNAMVESAQQIIDSLANLSDNVQKFNDALVELFKVLPRKMRTVKGNLAKSTEDIPKIYQREQDLLDVMKGQVHQRQVNEKQKNDKETKENKSTNDKESTKENNQTILEAMGIEIVETTKQEQKEIQQALGSIGDKFYQAWKVKNIRTQKNFDKYMETVDNKTTKLLFHGSRSENWWSIINSGLVLRPNAKITGKMFRISEFILLLRLKKA